MNNYTKLKLALLQLTAFGMYGLHYYITPISLIELKQEPDGKTIIA